MNHLDVHIYSQYGIYLHFQTVLVMLEVVAGVLLRTSVSCSGMRLGNWHHSGGLKLQDDVEIDLQDENSFDQDSTSNRLKEHYCCSLAYLRIENVLVKEIQNCYIIIKLVISNLPIEYYESKNINTSESSLSASVMMHRCPLVWCKLMMRSTLMRPWRHGLMAKWRRWVCHPRNINFELFS